MSPQDLQNSAVRERIQSFMDSRGFPPLWADEEYSLYFEKIFGDDRERQRKYLQAILSEERVSLTVGNRVLGAMMASKLARVVFTTNFDTVVERSVAEVAGKSLQAYSLEGTNSAKNALNNEEYPFYCKLHGDFRFESLKNLQSDLAEQNRELSDAFLTAASRFGFVVAGYSGRDASVMSLFAKALEGTNPFPHGLYWTGLKGSGAHPSVTKLLFNARDLGVQAEYVDIETFDSMMSRLWRNLDNRPGELDARVRKSQQVTVDIPLPSTGKAKPLVRLNGLPVVSMPTRCVSLTFKAIPEWGDIRQAMRQSGGTLVLTKSDGVWGWGSREAAEDAFGAQLTTFTEMEIPADALVLNSTNVKSLYEEAITTALARNKPLLARTRPSCGYLIVDPHTDDIGPLEPLQKLVGKTSGIVPGLLSPTSEDHPEAEKVRWAEALRISLDLKSGKTWLLLEPDIWIWPTFARSAATDFLSRRRANRYNRLHNQLLDAWKGIALGTETKNTDVTFRSFDSGSDAENPTFRIGTRTSFSRRLTS